MARKKQSETKSDAEKIISRLDAILAVLLRQMSDDHISKWNKGDKSNIVNLLIDSELTNEDVSKLTTLTYGSVANIRSKKKGKK